MDASEWPASVQLLYVKLAAKRGNWRDLARRGLEPTEMMKQIYISMRAKYIQWKRRRDTEDELEAAIPKQWFELTPGHWVRASSEESARKFTAEFSAASQTHGDLEDTRHFTDIDTSKTCSCCTMRRVEPGRAFCGNCISLGYEK